MSFFTRREWALAALVLSLTWLLSTAAQPATLLASTATCDTSSSLLAIGFRRLDILPNKISTKDHGRQTVSDLTAVWVRIEHEVIPTVSQSGRLEGPPSLDSALEEVFGLDPGLDLRERQLPTMCKTALGCLGEAARGTVNGTTVVAGWTANRSETVTSTVRNYLTSDDYANANTLTQGSVVSLVLQFIEYYINIRVASRYAGNPDCTSQQQANVVEEVNAACGRLCSKLESLQRAENGTTLKAMQSHGYTIPSNAKADSQTNAVSMSWGFSDQPADFSPVCQLYGLDF
ncbi:GPI anchored protein [Pseudozyma hubeiensis SY62]|uniref:GPI anchored protein n=1 Tax=Pseudozyma hubeiensis (strain SY62) TaxID=1305764 RepID=R9PAU3_PSEHS|nr:GPI anchored protein [Pseudozyma hubeiensis SY62]GAC98496.1 GPI anchored protein [Pseudozyma hubeiensis SY62]